MSPMTMVVTGMMMRRRRRRRRRKIEAKMIRPDTTKPEWRLCASS